MERRRRRRQEKRAGGLRDDCIVACDSSKFGQTAFARIAGLDVADLIVTDADIDAVQRREYHRHRRDPADRLGARSRPDPGAKQNREHSMPPDLPREVDTIVIGAGSGGAAFAGTLAAHSTTPCSLLEAGPDYGASPAAAGRPTVLDAKAIPLSHDWGLHPDQRRRRSTCPERA